MGLLCWVRPLQTPAWRFTLAICARGSAHRRGGSLGPLASAQPSPASVGGAPAAGNGGAPGSGGSGSGSSAFTTLPPGGSVTAAGMVQTRRGAAAELAETCRLEHVVSNLRSSCSATPVGQPVSSKFAAVLVPLFEDPDSGEVHVVLNQRSSKLKTHSGEVCFPGGKRDPADADDIATALREAQEELGIEPSAVQVVACLPPFLSKHLLSVTPVVALIPPHYAFTPNPTEVAAVFTVPLRRFLEAGDGYSSRDVEWQPGLQYRLHYFDYAHNGRPYCIWGLTAGMLIVVAEKAFGRRPAFAPNPPGALPYQSLAVDEGGALVWRHGGSGGPRDALGLAAEAAAEESPRSAAALGAVVTDSEAAAALGGGSGGDDGSEGGDSRGAAL